MEMVVEGVVHDHRDKKTLLTSGEVPDVYPRGDTVHTLPQRDQEVGLTMSQPTYKPISAKHSPSDMLKFSSGHDRDQLGLAGQQDIVLDILSRPKPSSKQRPGVILLGRGNSFSLGRSEVIFLPRARPTRGRPASHMDKSSLSSVAETSVTHNQQHNGPSPPDLSNHGVLPESSSTSATGCNPISGVVLDKIISEEDKTSESQINSSESNDDSLESLWRQAEIVMGTKQKAVLGVLAQFGVRGEECEDVDLSIEVNQEEEDRLWHLIENKMPAIIG